MRAIRFALVAAALAIGAVASVAPASAHIHFGGGGFGHFGGFHHFGHWGYGGFDAGYSGYDDCIRYRPVYDGEGDYMGRRPVNVCE